MVGSINMAQNAAIDRLGATGKPVFFKSHAAEFVALLPQEEGAVRLVTRSLGGMQKEALVASASAGAVWRLASDEGAYLAGLDAAPCPLSFFTVGMVSELHAGMLRLGEAAGIALRGLRLTLDSYYTMRGSALQGTMLGGARDARLTVQAPGPAASAEILLGLAHDAAQSSAIARLAREQIANRFALSCNAINVPVSELQQGIDQETSADDAVFEHAQPAAGDWSALIVRGGLTPRAPHTSTLAGGSLAPEQDRVLHVRGVSSLREDGLLQVEQWLFNPHGSMFSFVCDARPGNSRGTKAPDPWAYAAAGMAFCFMTQFGRYAQIARLPLEDCRLVQDMRFAEGQPANPVETAVRLRGGFTVEQGAAQLRMAERTCFLHALCRSSVRIRLATREWSEEPPEPSGAPG
jgi:uncharacterized OsmC-like protein